MSDIIKWLLQLASDLLRDDCQAKWLTAFSVLPVLFLVVVEASGNRIPPKYKWVLSLWFVGGLLGVVWRGYQGSLQRQGLLIITSASTHKSGMARADGVLHVWVTVKAWGRTNTNDRAVKLNFSDDSKRTIPYTNENITFHYKSGDTISLGMQASWKREKGLEPHPPQPKTMRTWNVGRLWCGHDRLVDRLIQMAPPPGAPDDFEWGADSNGEEPRSRVKLKISQGTCMP